MNIPIIEEPVIPEDGKFINNESINEEFESLFPADTDISVYLSLKKKNPPKLEEWAIISPKLWHG